MDNVTISLMVLLAIGILTATAITWLVLRSRRTEILMRRFGTEYEVTVDELGSRAAAEAELIDRMRRVKLLEIHPLSPSDRDRFANRWRKAQATFVDNPIEAVAEADALVEEVMEARGYPVADFDRRAADISVLHPRLVQNYRDAHALAMSARRGTVRTEDLRRAVVQFRALFEDLLERVSRRPAEAAR